MLDLAAAPHPAYTGPLAELLDGWIDPVFGIVTSLSELPAALDGHPWWVVAANFARTPPGNWYAPFPAGAAGCSIDREAAMTGALGEILERYSALSHDPRPGLTRMALADTPYADAMPRCHQGEACPPEFRLDRPDLAVACVPMKRLADGTESPYPADWACLNHEPGEGEARIAHPISTGLAAHSDLAEAIWRGYCEVVERDAMMTMWWLNRPVRRLVLPGNLRALPGPLADRLSRIARAGKRAELYEIGTEKGLPCLFAILLSPSYPHAVAGASAGPDPVAAVCKALDETVSVRLTMPVDPGPLSEEMRGRFDWVVSLHHHAVLYADRNGARSLPALLGRNAEDTPAEAVLERSGTAPKGLRGLKTLARRRAGEGFDMLWMDVTCGEAEGRYHVVKVVVPQMQPLSQAHACRWLGSARLAALAGRALEIADFTPYPHPFA